MKRAVWLLTILALTAMAGFAQEEPIPPKRSKAVKFGFFGGYTPGWVSVDVAPINAFLQKTPLKDNGVFLHGGAGAAYIMFVPNLRVGGLGMSGSISSSAVDNAGFKRDAKLKLGFGGVTIEYVIPIVERLDVAVGGMLGTGGIDLVLSQSNGANDTWTTERDAYNNVMIGNSPNATPPNVTRTLNGSYFVYIPSVNIEYAFLGWMAVRAGVSYVGMAAPSWKVDATYDLSNVPDNVSGKGLMINAGLLVGIF